MDKRETVLALAETGKPGRFTPAAFFLHFPAEFHTGRPAIQRHIEYFRASGNDILKVQYEHPYPSHPITDPTDWRSVPQYGVDFYQDQIDVVAGLVRELKSETVIIVTLYSAYMFASHFAGWEKLDAHMLQDPEMVRIALDRIALSMGEFIRACVAAGADGFYVSTQGGEAGRFPNPALFDDYIVPVEMNVWNSIHDAGATFNVLHVCDYERPYENLDRYVEYPGDIISAPLSLSNGRLTGREVANMFGRPFMGGLERLDALSNGSPDDVQRDAVRALQSGPEAMILGADCTLSATAPWENVRRATDVAHAFRR